MKRWWIRPRPLDIHKKLPLVMRWQDLDDGDVFFLNKDLHEQVSATPVKKVVRISDIPTPGFLLVDSYEGNYTCTFVQPQSYIRARPRGKSSIPLSNDLYQKATKVAILPRDAASETLDLLHSAGIEMSGKSRWQAC